MFEAGSWGADFHPDGRIHRLLAARFLGLEGETGEYSLMLGTALLILGREHGRPAIKLRNDACHLKGFFA